MQQQQLVTAAPSAIVTQTPRINHTDTDWLRFFDPAAAVQSVIDHIESLPGSRNERHTMRAYLTSLADYCRWLGADVVHGAGEAYAFDFSTMTLPTREGTAAYIGKCKSSGLTSATVTRYMAAVRHFLRSLDEQPVRFESGADFFYITECQRQFRLSGSVKNPPADRTSNRPALEQHGTRLTLAQVNIMFASFDGEIDTLSGLRDFAILYLGITSGLRASEIARVTLNSISQGDDCYELRVRGKRSNFDPVGIDNDAFTFIMDFVAAWNSQLDADDARRISGDVPVFQPVQKNNTAPTVGSNGYDPARGITSRAVLEIVERRSLAALGQGIAAHDMRRTCAYLMRNHGYEWDQIRAQLRHRSIATTEKYVGQKQDLSKSLLKQRVTFTLPRHTESAEV